MWFIRLLVLLFCVALLQNAVAIGALRLAGVSYLSLTEVAKLMEYSVSETEDRLTVRTEEGVLVVFDGSPDILWQAAGEALAEDGFSLIASVRRQHGDWYAPAQLFERFGMALDGEFLVLPTGRRVGLEFPQTLATESSFPPFQTVELGNGVQGLALYAPGSSGLDTVSMLLVDIGVMGLAFPEQQAELDRFMAEFEEGRALYFVITAVSASPWETELTFQQGNEQVSVRYPNGLSVLAGEVGQVSPAAPVSGVLRLPKDFSLRRPITISWAGVTASFQFRR